MKVLISAYACSPYKGSEPGVGWGFIKELTHLHDLCVITESSFKEDIDKYLNENIEFKNKIRFEYLPRIRYRTLERIWPPSYYWTYRLWHKEAYRLATSLHKKITFDLAHQLTMVGFREPGYLWKLRIPFVWGPIGGMGLFPWRFLPVVGVYGAIYYLCYNLINAWQMRFSKRPRLAAIAAGSGLIVATPENQAGAEKYWGNIRSTLISEVGLSLSARVVPMTRTAEAPLCLVWTGQHIPCKALNLTLEALAELPDDVNWELHILGKGKRTLDWQRLSVQLGIKERCHFYGWVPRDKAMEIMASSHVMLITSLRDLTSTVTIEALALGLPIVCLDHCGFAGVVDETCSIKVPVTSPTKSVRYLSEAIVRLFNDELLRQKLSQGAVARAAAFSWERKVNQVNSIYKDVLVENLHRSQ